MNLHPLFWHWWIAGLVLVTVEAFFPGAFFLWLGISGLVVGTLLWLVPGLGLLIQVTLFAVIAVASALAWRRFRPAKNVHVESGLNDRGRGYTGRRFTLETPIVNGIGQVRVDDGQWRIAGPDLPAGSCVRVIAMDGATLKVEKAD
ncbi:MAG TPA: NfeD family protein [Nevskia sp.]|nr:NfeD family protein [Nevskia sp.]